MVITCKTALSFGIKICPEIIVTLLQNTLEIATIAVAQNVANLTQIKMENARFHFFDLFD